MSESPSDNHDIETARNQIVAEIARRPGRVLGSVDLWRRTNGGLYGGAVSFQEQVISGQTMVYVQRYMLIDEVWTPTTGVMLERSDIEAMAGMLGMEVINGERTENGDGGTDQGPAGAVRGEHSVGVASDATLHTSDTEAGLSESSGSELPGDPAPA